MKSHKMAHEGQWKCQRGCKEAFKTWTILDEHHKSKHSVPKAPEFKCAQCDLIFTSKQHLRQHVVTKHERSNNSNMPIRVSCEYCGLITNSHQEMINHKRDCNSEFSRVSNKVCKYFLNRGCLKCESCIFKHPQEIQERAPPCRNGFQCRYLANGVCIFYHRGIGVQKPRNQEQQINQPNKTFQRQPKRWCRFLEDCNRVPNCAFNHYEEDFPNLTKTNNPPIGKKSWGWEEY